MTFVKSDIFKPYDREIICTDTYRTLVDFLHVYFPDGFEKPTEIHVNAKKVEVENYDITLNEKDVVVLLERPELPIGLIGGWLITALANIAISVAVGYALNKIFAPELNANNYVGGTSPTAQNNTASSVYNLNSSQNTSKAGQTIPVIYGRVRAYPSLINPPYYRYENNEQYLYQLMCVGMGKYDLQNIYISDQNVNNDSDVLWQMLDKSTFWNIPANVPDDYYREAVSTLATPSNYDLISSGGGRATFQFVYPDEIRLYHPGTAGIVPGHKLVFSNANLNLKIFTVLAVTFVWISDTEEYYVLNTAESVANQAKALRYFGFYHETAKYTLHSDADVLEVDYQYPQGLNNIGDLGEMQYLDDVFNIYIWRASDNALLKTIPIRTIDHTINAIRKTYRYGLGEFGTTDIKVSFAKVTASSTGTRATTRLIIERIKGLLPTTEKTSYGDITLLWVRIKASNAISSAGQTQVNGYFVRTDVINDVARVLEDIYTNTTYGARLPASDLDFTGGADGVNCAFEDKQTVYDAMNLVAKSQKYTLYPVGQELLLKKDEAKTITTALYNETNIIKNSIQIRYNFREEVTDSDSYECTYMDYTTWKQQSAIYPTTGIYPKQINLFGVTASAKAEEMAKYFYKQEEYRRKIISFDTDIQGLVPHFLDKILISHSAIKWGTAGQVYTLNGNAIELSDPLNELTATTMVFRNDVGGVSDGIAITVVDEYNIIVTGTLPAWVTIDTFYTVGETREYIVTNVKPKGELVTIEVVNYSAEVYT